MLFNSGRHDGIFLQNMRYEYFVSTLIMMPFESKKARRLKRPLLPEYISNDILQYLIEYTQLSLEFSEFFFINITLKKPQYDNLSQS